MPTWKQKRRMGQVFTQVGAANAQIRQSVNAKTVAGEIIDHLNVIHAALDAASVELVALATNEWGCESYSMENSRLDTRIPKITRDQAIGGLQVLTWKRMVGLRSSRCSPADGGSTSVHTGCTR